MAKRKSKRTKKSTREAGPTTDPAPQPSNSTTSAQDAGMAPLEEALHAAVDQVDSQEKADDLLEKVTQQTGKEPVAEVADDEGSKSAAEAVAAVEQKEGDETAVLTESARAVAETEGEDRTAISDAVQEVFNPEQQGEAATQETERFYLRHALLKRLGPLDALDAQLFLWVNGLPHPRLLNRFFYFLTQIYRGGAGWYALMLVLLACRPRLGWRVIRRSALPLGLAIWLVEYPIKSYFRRRRPFITIVQAMVIGRKPGSWSFPSGHSATAYAGAWLLSRCLPRWRFPLYLVGTLTAFGRIYLGAHYPGDVVAGSTLGVLFAWLLQRFPTLWRASKD